MENYSSRLLENAVNELSRLPGIGRKTALRLALHLLKKDEVVSTSLGNAILELRSGIQYCSKCHNISDKELCNICSDAERDMNLICVVEDIRDVMAIENTGQFKGYYHVLGGIISPMEGVGPEDLNIHSLINRIDKDNVKEVVMALPSTMEGDTTNFYIFKMIGKSDLKISVIARGISVGDELEYADEVTLGRSIINRLPYESTLKQ